MIYVYMVNQEIDFPLEDEGFKGYKMIIYPQQKVTRETLTRHVGRLYEMMVKEDDV